MTFKGALDAVSEWSRSLDKSHPTDKVGSMSRREFGVLMCGVFVPLCVSVFSVTWISWPEYWQWWPEYWRPEDGCVRIIGLGALVITYFVLLLYQVVAFWRGRVFFKMVIGTPFDLLLDNIRHSAPHDELLFRKLRCCDLFVLEQLICKLNLEREHIKIRVNLLIGPLTKAGFFAGLLSLFLHFEKVETKFPSWISNETLNVFACVMAGLYFMGLNCYRPLMRSERAVRLAELVLADRQRSNPSLQPTPLTRRG